MLIDSRKDVLHLFRDSPTAGQNGLKRTVQRIRRRFYWPELRRTVATHVGMPEVQVFDNEANQITPNTALRQAYGNYFSRLLWPVAKTNRDNNWILVVEDVDTRWVELFPLGATSAEKTAKYTSNKSSYDRASPDDYCVTVY